MQDKNQTIGWWAGVGAFIWWGLAPIYFKLLNSVDALEILFHRVAWCVPTTLLLMLVLKRQIQIKALWANKKTRYGLMLSTVFISVNWYIFTWAVTHEQILATSLGYFINPLMNMVLGVMIFKERLTPLAWAAVGLATLGVLNQIYHYGEVPWLSLSLATSFATYGLIRKTLPVGAMNGLLVETLIALPFALLYLLYLGSNGEAAFLNQSLTIDLTLAAGGIVTAIPLVWFATATQNIPLNAVGFLQFIAPTLTFFLAVFVYQEPLGTEKLISFVFIWSGLVLYSIQSLRRSKKALA